MSKWRIGTDDLGKMYLCEMHDDWGGGETFATESEAVAELRRLHMGAVLRAEESLDMARAKLAAARVRLDETPRSVRLRDVQRTDSPTNEP